MIYLYSFSEFFIKWILFSITNTAKSILNAQMHTYFATHGATVDNGNKTGIYD